MISVAILTDIAFWSCIGNFLIRNCICRCRVTQTLVTLESKPSLSQRESIKLVC